jgi:hypothetical protein
MIRTHETDEQSANCQNIQPVTGLCFRQKNVYFKRRNKQTLEVCLKSINELRIYKFLTAG